MKALPYNKYNKKTKQIGAGQSGLYPPERMSKCSAQQSLQIQ